MPYFFYKKTFKPTLQKPSFRQPQYWKHEDVYEKVKKIVTFRKENKYLKTGIVLSIQWQIWILNIFLFWLKFLRQGAQKVMFEN